MFLTRFSCFRLIFKIFLMQNRVLFSSHLQQNHIFCPSFWGCLPLYSPFMVNAIRFLAISTDSTFTLTISPTLSTSRGCLIKRSLI